MRVLEDDAMDSKGFRSFDVFRQVIEKQGFFRIQPILVEKMPVDFWHRLDEFELIGNHGSMGKMKQRGLFSHLHEPLFGIIGEQIDLIALIDDVEEDLR